MRPHPSRRHETARIDNAGPGRVPGLISSVLDYFKCVFWFLFVFAVNYTYFPGLLTDTHCRTWVLNVDVVAPVPCITSVATGHQGVTLSRQTSVHNCEGCHFGKCHIRFLLVVE